MGGSIRIDVRNNTEDFVLEFRARETSHNLSRDVSADVLVVVFLLFLLLVFHDGEDIVLVTSDNGDVRHLLVVV